jgi:hypothetical protein
MRPIKKTNGEYNMKRALELQAMGVPGFTKEDIAKADGHWPSVDPTTGMLLKSKDHPTIKLEFISTMLNPNVGKLRVDPEGYFGESQLKYKK